MQRATRGKRALQGAHPGEASMAPGAAASHRATRPHPTLMGIGPRALAGVQPLPMPFAIGSEILAERKRYQTMSLIGAGERTLVIEALDREGARVVALKCLRPEFAVDAGAAELFLERARANLVLDCDHVARVHEVGRLADGGPFLAMDRLRGCDLRSLLGDAGGLLTKRACALALQLCEALATGHAAGVLHRGLKPENVVVGREGAGERLQLLEFGTSCQDHAAPRGSGPRRAPDYRPPEQRSARELDERSDLWSLGCLLYEMLTGRAPQFGVRRGRDGARHEAPIVPLRSLRPELPAELIAVVGRCLAEVPEQRFQDVAELARALVLFAPPAAHAHAERCAELLGREPERASGVRRVLRDQPYLPPAPPLHVLEEQPRGAWLGPLALVLCVPLVSALGWLYAALPDVSLPAAAGFLRARLDALLVEQEPAHSATLQQPTEQRGGSVFRAPAQTAPPMSGPPWPGFRMPPAQAASEESGFRVVTPTPIVTPLEPAAVSVVPALDPAAATPRRSAAEARTSRPRPAVRAQPARAEPPLPLYPFKPDPYARGTATAAPAAHAPAANLSGLAASTSAPGAPPSSAAP